jgi:hypothetical protein
MHQNVIDQSYSYDEILQEARRVFFEVVSAGQT